MGGVESTVEEVTDAVLVTVAKLQFSRARNRERCHRRGHHRRSGVPTPMAERYRCVEASSSSS